MFTHQEHDKWLNQMRRVVDDIRERGDEERLARIHL